MAPELPNAAVKACIEGMSELLERAASLGRATKVLHRSWRRRRRLQ
jgi:hypothetical protein